MTPLRDTGDCTAGTAGEAAAHLWKTAVATETATNPHKVAENGVATDIPSWFVRPEPDQDAPLAKMDPPAGAKMALLIGTGTCKRR